MKNTKVIEAKPVNENTQVATTTADTMIQMAIEQNADVDKLERLIAMKERWDATEARKQYVSAISHFSDECPSIVKTKKGHNSSYAPLPEILRTIKPAMKSCRLSHSWHTNKPEGVPDVPGAIHVTCVITHAAGHSESTTLSSLPETSGSKNAVQSIGSAITYLQRYTLMSALGLSASDDDDGAAAAESQILQRRKDMTAKLKEAFSGDGAAVADWLKEKGLGHVRTANDKQIDAIEEALAGRK